MNKKAIRIISVILLQTFIFYGTALGSVDTSQPIAQSPESKVLSIDTIGLPKDIGSVKSKYQGKNGKLIIHIQDAHCNYEAQGNISKILEIFSKDYNINTISVEGADGYIDTSWFKAFPDAEIRKEVADYFMKKGEITGAEFLSITSDYPIKLFGAENRNLYIKNLNAFTTTYPHKERIEKYLLGVKSILRRLKGYVYTKKLKEFDGKIEEYKDKEITLSDYAKILSLKLKRYNVNLKAYPNFSKLIYTLVYEDKIDFDTVDGERAALIDKLSKDLPKDELQELVLQSFSFKTGKLGPDEYYGYLRDITKAHSIDLAKDYPNLSNYVIYTKLYARIENENLFNELEDIKNSVKEKLFENDDQRDLSACWDNVNILIGLINIKLSNREFAYYASNRKKFNPDFFMNFVNSQVSRYNLAYSIEEPSEFIKTNLPKLEEFYEIATKRDRALVDNTLKTMKSEKTDAAILISGGFHTEGISDLLEKKGVSYVVVCPNITKDVESPYIQVLTNQKTPFEELLIESAAPRKDDSLLAPLVLSRLMLSDVREVKWFDKHITGLAKRLRGAKVNFTKRCVAHWIKKAPMLAREHNIPLDNDIFRESYIHALRQRATALNFAPDKANAIVELAEEELDELLTERYHPEGSFFTLDDVDVEGKTVGVRVDINLPEDQFENLVLIDRLPATAETIKEIADKGGKVVVFGHQGRKYKKNGEPNLNFEASMSGHAELFRYLIPEHEIIVVNDLFGNMAQEAIRNLQESQILFLNNVRDWDGEEKVSVDPAQSELVQNIEPLLDLYVIDGFSVSHRAQPSVVGFSRIPNVAGRLMQRELQGLEKVIENIEAPYVMCLGGKKADDYIGLIAQSLKKDVKHILTGGGLALAILKSRGANIGRANEAFLQSNISVDEVIKKLQQLDRDHPGALIVPEDFLIAEVETNDEEGWVVKQHRNVPAERLADPKNTNLAVFDIGKATTERYVAEFINSAKTVLLKGPLGAADMHEIFENGTRMVWGGASEKARNGELFLFGGGGESGSIIEKWHLFLSHRTLGGGSTLEGLEKGLHALPGVVRLKASASRGIPAELVNDEIEAPTPGAQAAVGRPLTDAEIPIADSVIHKMFAKPRIKSGKTKLIPFDQARKGFAFGRHEGLLDAREKAGLPVDVNNPHPGTGGKGLMQAHIDAFLYDNLTEAERLIVANHELAHLDIANGFPRGSNPNNTTYRAYIAAITKALNANARLDQKKFQEDFVNSLPDCDTTPIAEKFEALLKIRAKAKAALANLEADKVTMANLEAVVSMDETLQRGDEGVRRIFQQIAQDYGNRKIGVFAKDYLHHRAQLDAISKIREIPTKEGSGFGAYIFVSSTQVNADYWQDRFEKGRGSVLPKDAIILSVSEHNWQDPKGASNGFGTFNGWKRAIKKYASMKGVTEAKAAKELMEICKKKGIVMMHMAGKATRMQTVAMDNKSAVRLPGTVMINGKPETPTIGEAVIMNFGLNVRPGRLTLAWGDQINIPSTDISSPNTHLAEIFGVTVPIEGREDFLPQKGLLASTGRGTDVHQREKLLIEEIKQRAAQFGRKDAEMSLGFNSFRWELLQAALNEFKPELTNEGNTTTSLMTSLNIDPEFWGPFTSTEGEYIAFMKNKKPDTMSKSAWEEQVKKHWTRVRKIFKSADRLSGGNFVVFDKNDPERRGIMQGISYGIALSKVPEITNTSEWWDAGLLKEYFDSLSILLRQPKDYREEWQAERLRRFLNLPRRDQWTSTSELGQTSVNNSLVLNSSVKKGRIVNSIVIGTTAEELNIKNAIVIGSTVYKLTAKGHNVITNLVSDFGEETTLEQDEILACHYHPDRGQLRMFESFANDIGKDYKQVIQVGNHPANPLSAEEVSNILKPLPVEKRLAEKKLAIARYKTPISVRRNMAPEWAAARDKYVYSQEEFPMALLGTSGERGTHQKQLTDVRIITMQKGNLSMLAQRYGVRPGEAIVFAGDLRPSTPRLAKDALIASLQDKFKVNWQGFVSTPTVVFWATTNGTPMVSIMVTASHNPVRAENETVEDMPSQFENNGLKLNSPHGEIYKEDEPWLVEHIKEAELMQCTVPWEEDICGRDGKLKAEGLSSDQQELVNLVEQIFANPGNEAREAYRLRNTTLGFGANAFNGEHIGFNEHTGVSRDELPLIMREVGLNTHTYGRSYWEERMDTEDLEANIEKHMKDEAARLKGEGIDVISHASTDGDADRPALFDSNGNFIYGDKICGLSCIFLRELFPQKDFTAVVTATCSEAMVKLLREKYGMKVIKVEVGSPFVVSEMEKQEKLNPDSIVVGFERNTGFFMQTPIKLPNGNTIQKLATRDATFVILSVNLLAKKRNLKTLESLVDSEYNDVYESYSWSGGIASSTPGCEAYTAPMGKAIMRSLSPRDRNMLVIEFDADGEVYYTTRPEYYGMAQSKGHNMAGAEVKDRMKNIQTYLSGVFTSKRGFGSIVKMEFIDGVRIFFDNGEITHLRPSGNEPKWRIYPESGKEKGKRARAISDMRLELYPQMIADYLKKIGTGAKKRIAPRSIEGIKVSLKKLLPSLEIPADGLLKTWEMKFGPEAQHFLEKGIIFAKDGKSFMIYSKRAYNKFAPRETQSALEVSLIAYPEEQRVVYSEIKDGKKVMRVEAKGEEAWVELGVGLDKNVPVGKFQDMIFPVMAQSTIENFKRSGVAFFRPLDMTSEDELEPSLWGPEDADTFEFKSTAAEPEVTDGPEALDEARKEVETLKPGRTILQTSPGAYSVSPGAGESVEAVQLASKKHAQKALLPHVVTLLQLPENAATVDDEGKIVFNDDELRAAYKDRGVHDATYMDVRGLIPHNDPHNLMFDEKAFLGSQNEVVYNMMHLIREIDGQKDELHVATHFAGESKYSGTDMLKTTGSHLQGRSLDYKYVREGYGLQLIIFEREDGTWEVIAVPLYPGAKAVSLPGTIDVAVDLGGLLFTDRSYKVSTKKAQEIAKRFNMSDRFVKAATSEKASAELMGQLPASGMPVVFFEDETMASVALNPLYSKQKVHFSVLQSGLSTLRDTMSVSDEDVENIIFNPTREAAARYVGHLKGRIESNEFADASAGDIQDALLDYVMSQERVRRYELDYPLVTQGFQLPYYDVHRHIQDGTPAQLRAHLEGKPWGGRIGTFAEKGLRILRNIPSYLGVDGHEVDNFVRKMFKVAKDFMASMRDDLVGEHWFSSVEPGQESEMRIAGTFDNMGDLTSINFAEIVSQNAVEMLGQEVVNAYGTKPILLKRLTPGNTPRVSDLSRQVHDTKNELWIISRTKDNKPQPIILGFNPKKVKALGTRDAFLRAYEEALVKYAKVIDAANVLLLGVTDGDYGNSINIIEEKPELLSPGINDRIRDAESTLNSFYNFVPVKAGDVIPIPKGTVHALLNGVEVIEPQIEGRTLPLEDGARYPVRYKIEVEDGRVKTIKGTPAEEVFAAMELEYKPTQPRIIRPTMLGGSVEELGAFPGLTVERITLKPNAYDVQDTGHGYHILIAAEGEAKVITTGGEFLLKAGKQPILVPATAGFYRIESEKGAQIIKAYAPVNETSLTGILEGEVEKDKDGVPLKDSHVVTLTQQGTTVESVNFTDGAIDLPEYPGKTHAELTLDQGESVKVADEKGRPIAQLAHGSPVIVPLAGKLTLRSEKGATVRVNYPQGDFEKATFVTLETLRELVKTGEIPQGFQVDIIADDRIYKDDNARKAEEAALNQFGIKARIIPIQGSLGLNDERNIKKIKKAKGKGRENAIPVLISTDKKLRQITEIQDKSVRKLLISAHKMALPEEHLEALKLQGKGFLFARTIEGAAVIAARVTAENIKEGDALAEALEKVMSQLHGPVTAESLLTMMPFFGQEITDAQLNDTEFILNNINRLIQAILITLPMEPHDAREEYQRRLEALWSV